jgi:hypothetical protein
LPVQGARIRRIEQAAREKIAAREMKRPRPGFGPICCFFRRCGRTAAQSRQGDKGEYPRAAPGFHGEHFN